MENIYMPIQSTIISIVPHTDIEVNFRIEFNSPCKPGQFVEVSITKYG